MPSPLFVTAGDKISIVMCHDDDDFWFAVKDVLPPNTALTPDMCPRKMCTCSFHSICSSQRLSLYNELRSQWTQYISRREVPLHYTCCIDLTDGPFLSCLLLQSERDGDDERKIIKIEVMY